MPTSASPPPDAPPPPPSRSAPQVHLFPLTAMFGLCSTFLVVATLCMLRLERLAVAPAPVIKGVPEVDDLLLSRNNGAP